MRNTQRIHLDFFFSDGNQKMKERKEDIEQPRDIKQEEKKRKKQF